MFTITVFEILPFKSRSVLAPAQRGTGGERVNQNSLGNIFFKFFQNF